jgi:hypothetical protein
VPKKFSPSRRLWGLFALLCLAAGPALSETCPECQRKVQVDVKTCFGQLPAKVKYADPRKPNDSERKADADRLDKSKACSADARQGYANCGRTANCP